MPNRSIHVRSLLTSVAHRPSRLPLDRPDQRARLTADAASGVQARLLDAEAVPLRIVHDCGSWFRPWSLQDRRAAPLPLRGPPRSSRAGDRLRRSLRPLVEEKSWPATGRVFGRGCAVRVAARGDPGLHKVWRSFLGSVAERRAPEGTQKRGIVTGKSDVPELGHAGTRVSPQQLRHRRLQRAACWHEPFFRGAPPDTRANRKIPPRIAYCATFLRS